MAGENTSQSAETQTLFFSLTEIASWIPGVCPEVKAKIRASIPALQRGLVWTPQQNELLWDSILRGFPIGAIVVTNWSEKLKKSGEIADGTKNYHLLDGQQRCNAIALGYSDPFAESDTVGHENSSSILWLDLKPKSEQNSTRNFWVRITTTAHPWGYSRDDNATRLTAPQIRQVLEALGLNAADPQYQRPFPARLWPSKAAATTPVPLSWLLRLPIDDEQMFWDKLKERAEENVSKFRWAEDIGAFCVDPATADIKSIIFKGIKRAHAVRLIAIEASEELLEVSEQEKSSGDAREDVSNIEQLFQRLNRQGTRLDGEELAYSMIKAYWPELEKPIDEASKWRMPQARMVSIGVRAALAKEARQRLPPTPTVSALRGIAKNVKDVEKKDLIQSFIKDDLRLACKLVGEWLLYSKDTNPSGLLPVHITSVAINSREVYLLLLHFATRMNGETAPKDWNKNMQALATILHWFAKDKGAVANRVFDGCQNEISLANISTALKDAIDKDILCPIHAPTAAADFLTLPEENLKDWNWWTPIRGDGTEDGILRRRKSWEGFLNKFRNERELLLYAQRGFLATRFHEYDPARTDLWEAHNRPWDFDHIFASVYFTNRKDQGPFRELCKQWGSTIGNLRAWPFEENRSDKADPATTKIKGADIRNCFLIDEDEVMAFSGENDTRHNETKAQLFTKTCRERLLRIYREWHTSVGIDKLIHAEEALSAPASEPVTANAVELPAKVNQ